MVSVLSIDGGGIKGIIPATYLVEIEKRTGRPICELFDLVAGTSTGGILAATLAVPDDQGGPKYTAQWVRSAYFEQGGSVFSRNPLRSVATLGGLTGPKYSARNLDTLLGRYLGETRLHETLTDIIVTAYDMVSSTPWFFKTSFAKRHADSREDDPLLTEVVRATTAAPTYFPPLAMGAHCLFDGGVFACNPALCAYAEARNLYPGEDRIFVVSLGTGVQTHDRTCPEVAGWGVAGWAVPISDVMLNASSATVDYQMRALVGFDNYTRFQLTLDGGSTRMDDASSKNIRRLESLAEQSVRENTAAIDRVCSALTKKPQGTASIRYGIPARR